MLKCVASKRRTLLLNKLNKSSAIHPGPEGSPVHVDQRRAAAACNITQRRRGPTGGKQRTRANAEPVRMQLQHLCRTDTPPSPLSVLPSWNIIQHAGGVHRGGEHLET